jgi:BirA family biotin operon repressor/biotin-[acetyl-CoA-carboxylase] ligase
VLSEVDSTNRVVAERAAAGEAEGLVVTTEHQTAGRGRLDRTWETGPGDALLVSILLRPTGLPPARWHLLTAAAGLAAVAACQEVGGFTPALKWPNDLLVGEAKLAGILAEATGSAVVVGMGLNVHAGPPGAAWADTSAGRRVGRSDLLGAYLAGLDQRLGRWDDIAREYRATCATVGRRVTVVQGEEHLTGRATGLDDDGRLLVEVDGPGAGGGAPGVEVDGPGAGAGGPGARAGRLLAVSAADVTHLRPAGDG